MKNTRKRKPASAATRARLMALRRKHGLGEFKRGRKTAARRRKVTNRRAARLIKLMSPFELGIPTSGTSRFGGYRFIRVSAGGGGSGSGSGSGS